MQVAGVGLSVVDMYEELDEFYPTGNSVNFLVHLSREKVDTAMYTIVGTDKHGRNMIEFLNKEKVDTSNIKVKDGETAIFKMTLENNERIHKEKIEGVMKDFSLSTNDISSLSKYDYIHTNFSGRAIEYLPVLQKNGSKIIFDYSFNVHKEYFDTLKYVNYAFFSYDGSNYEYIKEFMKEVYEKGPEIVIVTMGGQGSLAYNGKQFYMRGVIPSKVINTVGAGDSFCAGFMLGVINNESVQKCLERGTYIAHKVVGAFRPY